MSTLERYNIVEVKKISGTLIIVVVEIFLFFLNYFYDHTPKLIPVASIIILKLKSSITGVIDPIAEHFKGKVY